MVSGGMYSVVINKSLVNKNVSRFCHSVAGPRNPGYAHTKRTNSKDFITWVPVSSTGMTEFLLKILFIFALLNFYLS